MNIIKSALEVKVTTQNKWLENHPDTHFAYRQNKQKRDYYISKLCTMDDLGLTTIKI